MYKGFIISVSLLLLLGGVGMMRSYGQESVTTTFIGSTIEKIDPESQQLTIRTVQGNTWSLEVADADLMKGLHKGDRASLELDAQGRVKKIVKSEAEGERSQPSAERPPDPRE